MNSIKIKFVNLFSLLFFERRRQEKRRLIRAVARLNQTNPMLIYDALAIGETTDLGFTQKHFSGLELDVTWTEMNYFIHQRLFNFNLSSPEFRPQILKMSEAIQKSLSGRLPQAWRRKFQEEGYPVNSFACKIFLGISSFRDWFSGIKQFIKLLCADSLFSSPPIQEYAVFVNLNHKEKILNHEEREAREPVMDLLGWYKRSKKVIGGVEHYWLHVSHLSTSKDKIWNFVKNPLPKIPNEKKWCFIKKGTYLIFLTGAKLLTGKWWAGILLRELLIANYAAQLDKRALAKEYIHDSIGSIVRPLWSYVVEKKGSRVLLVQFSLNCLPFSQTTKPKPCLGWGSQIMTWPNVIVMSKEIGALFKQQKNIKANIIIDTQVCYIDNGEPLFSKRNNKSVCAFDVSPLKRRLFVDAGLIAPYYFGPQAAKKFFIDVKNITAQHGWSLNYKAKKNNANYIDSSYLNMQNTNNFIADDNVELIDSNVAPYRVIMNSTICICLPFTSPAVTAKEMGKPTIYYDPIGTLSSICPVMHGIDVISGQRELGLWFTSTSTALLSQNMCHTN
jgi:polysaccharide biosynthesis PFTS motif protein